MRLNLGSGYQKIEGYVNIDNRIETKPDMLFDLTEKWPFADSTIDEVRAYDVFEHIPIGKTVFVVEEIFRVLKLGGRLEFFTPSTDGRGAFQDPSHVSFWNANSWLYYTDDDYRRLYGIKAKFRGKIKTLATSKKMSIFHDYGELFAVKQNNEYKSC